MKGIKSITIDINEENFARKHLYHAVKLYDFIWVKMGRVKKKGKNCFFLNAYKSIKVRNKKKKKVCKYVAIITERCVCLILEYFPVSFSPLPIFLPF